MDKSLANGSSQHSIDQVPLLTRAAPGYIQARNSSSLISCSAH